MICYSKITQIKFLKLKFLYNHKFSSSELQPSTKTFNTFFITNKKTSAILSHFIFQIKLNVSRSDKYRPDIDLLFTCFLSNVNN